MSTADNRFKEGACYFLLGYYDQRFEFPYVQTFVYIGKNLDGDEAEDRWFFQEPKSYLEHGATALRDQPDDAGILTVDEDALEGFVDARGLAESLIRPESM